MKILKKIFFASSLAAALVFGACSSQSGSYIAATAPQEDIAAALDNSKWVPFFVVEESNISVPPNAQTEFGKIFISFKRERGKTAVYGMSGANIFRGEAEIKNDGEIEFKNITSTMRMGRFAEYEALFLKALADAKFAELAGASTLFLYDDNFNGERTLIMKLERIPN